MGDNEHCLGFRGYDYIGRARHDLRRRDELISCEHFFFLPVREEEEVLMIYLYLDARRVLNLLAHCQLCRALAKL